MSAVRARPVPVSHPIGLVTMRQSAINSGPVCPWLWSCGLAAIVTCGCGKGNPAYEAPTPTLPPSAGASVSAAPEAAAPEAAAPEAGPGPGETITTEPAPPYFNPLTPEQIADGWVSLFDGHSLFGWVSNTSETNW